MQTKRRSHLKQLISQTFKDYKMLVLSVNCQLEINSKNLRSLANHHKYQKQSQQKYKCTTTSSENRADKKTGVSPQVSKIKLNNRRIIINIKKKLNNSSITISIETQLPALPLSALIAKKIY